MGWFEEQIHLRHTIEDEELSESFVQIADAILGTRYANAGADEQKMTLNAIKSVMQFYNVYKFDIPEKIGKFEERLEYVCRPNGLMRRAVSLYGDWYGNCFGAMIAFYNEDGVPVALVPGKDDRYYFINRDGKKCRVNAKNAGLFETEAICFYKPLPLRKIGISDLLKYIVSVLSPRDIVAPLIALGIATVMGLMLPGANYLLTQKVVYGDDYMLLISVLVFMLSLTVSTAMLSGIRTILNGRLSYKIGICVEAATMMRILSLPASFFREHSSGELSSRAANINTLCDTMVSVIFNTSFSALFSLLYIVQMKRYASALALPGIVIIVLSLAVSIISTLLRIRLTRKALDMQMKESNMSFGILNGIQKIKLSGAENRAFTKWAQIYAKRAEIAYNPPFFLKIDTVLTTAVSLIGTIVLYYNAANRGVSVSEYFAFNSAYAMVLGALTQVSLIVSELASVKPVLEMVKPILEAEPEVSENRAIVTDIRGNIEFDNVSFSYSADMPNVIENLNLKIRNGEYLAIVGETGCGKSTLVRLMLGFEKPSKGAIMYDGRDMEKLDLKSLRRKMGVVLQNGRLFQGDLFSNITISAPTLTMDDAWEAAKIAGMDEDIAKMPMGMYTLVSEGGGSISGGQRQRLMIARAVANKPKILIMDEATSALDNITQKKVSEALDGMKCTRIVIAHRLSTIKNCDRVVLLEKGRIVEDGNYDELIALNGKFAKLVERQRIDA